MRCKPTTMDKLRPWTQTCGISHRDGAIILHCLLPHHLDIVKRSRRKVALASELTFMGIPSWSSRFISTSNPSISMETIQTFGFWRKFREANEFCKQTSYKYMKCRWLSIKSHWFHVFLSNFNGNVHLILRIIYRYTFWPCSAVPMARSTTEKGKKSTELEN